MTKALAGIALLEEPSGEVVSEDRDVYDDIPESWFMTKYDDLLSEYVETLRALGKSDEADKIKSKKHRIEEIVPNDTDWEKEMCNLTENRATPQEAEKMSSHIALLSASLELVDDEAQNI